MELHLFPPPACGHPPPPRRDLSQYFTPAWAAAELTAEFCQTLAPGSTICEPACGDGAFLQAIPPAFFAFGVEIDPIRATIARARAGRPVIVSDFEKARLPGRIDAFLGNPPWCARWIEMFLKRALSLLPEGGKAALIQPAYAFSLAERVRRYNEHFTISFELLPTKSLFPGVQYPAGIAIFTRDRRPHLVGLRLHQEAAAFNRLPEEVQQNLVAPAPTTHGLWDAVAETSLRRLGGEGSLQEIYRTLNCNQRPSGNPAWREKIRQTVRRHPDKYLNIDRGFYRLAA